MDTARPQQRDQRAPWEWDAELVDTLAIDNIGRFCGAIGTGRALGFIPLPAWWGGHAPTAETQRLHGLDGWRLARHVLLLQAAPKAKHVLAIHIPTGEWREPSLALQGPSFMSLAARRWGMSETKAAWRWAKLCGLASPRIGR